MPERHTKVEASRDSGEVRVVMPAQSAREPPKDTQVGVTPGTSEHEFTVKDALHEDDMTETAQADRRKPQPSAVVNVQQPQSAGLTGKWSSIANMSAVGFVLVLCFLMYKDGQSNQREFLNYAREESRTVRSENQAANGRTDAAIASLGSKVDALVTSATALIASNNAVVNTLVAEMKAARFEMAAVVKLLTDRKMVPDPEPMSAAPMPRVKATDG